MISFIPRLAQYSRTSSLYFLVALGFVIPISTALTNLFLILLLVTWLFSGLLGGLFAASSGALFTDGFAAQWGRVKASSAALWSLAVFGLFVLAAFYSPLTWHEASRELLTQKKVLLVPLLVALLAGHQADDKWCWRALYALFSTLLLTLLLSYLVFLPAVAGTWLGTLYKAHLPLGAVFVNRTTQGMWFILAGWACYGVAYFSRHQTENGMGAIRHKIAGRGLWLSLGLLFHINVLYFVSGRTSLVTFIPVTIVACLLISRASLSHLLHLSWRRGLIAIVSLCVLTGLIYVSSSYVQIRLHEMVSEIVAYRDKAEATSSGLRLFYYEHGWALFTQSPIWGYGTSSIHSVFTAYIAPFKANLSQWTTTSLHNQFLNWAFQFGIFGLILILFSIWRYWTAVRTAANPLTWYLMGVLLGGYLFSNLLNSAIDSFYEGYFFYFVVGLLVASSNTFNTPNTDPHQPSNPSLKKL